MELPQPVTREELYLAYYVGMRGFSLPSNPATRIELYLAKLCGQSVSLPSRPVTNAEFYLAKLCGEAVTLPDAPVLRVEMYLAALCGETVTLPEEPYTKTEIYLAYAATTTVYDVDIDGDAATLEDTLEGANLYDPKLGGKIFQQTYSGKNLNGGYPNSSSITRSGVSFVSNTDGTISANGTATDTNALSMYASDATTAGWIRTYQAGTYTLSGGTSDISVFLTATDGSTSHSTNFTSDTTTFTLTEPQTAYIRIQVKNGTTVNTTIKPMLVVGSTAGDYEPYTGGLPAPNPDFPMPIKTVTGEQTIKVVGKNIWNPTAYQENHFISANGTESTNTTTNTWGNIYAPAGTSMAISATPGDTSSTAIRVHAFTLAGVWKEQVAVLTLTGGNYGSATFTTPNEPVLLRWCGSKKLSSCQLEIGSTATAYEPYQSQSYEVNLGKNLFTLDGITPTGNQYITYEQLGSNSLKLTSLSGIGSYSDKTFKYSLKQLGLKVGDTVSLKMDMAGTYASRQCRVYYNAIPSTVVATLTPTDNAKTFTIPSGTTDILLLFYVANGETPSANSTATYSNIQLELGSTPTDFAPYFPPIELCGIEKKPDGTYTYQDYIWKDGADWKIHKAIAHKQLDVSITGIRQDGNAHADYVSYSGAFAITGGAWNSAGGDYDNDIANARQSTNCGQYLLQSIGSNVTANAMVDGTFCQRSATNDRIYMRFSALAGKTGAEAKAILSAQGGADFWYYLSTATDTTITDAALIAQLEALANAYTYEGTTNIFISNSGGGLTVEYSAKVRKAGE